MPDFVKMVRACADELNTNLPEERLARQMLRGLVDEHEQTARGKAKQAAEVVSLPPRALSSITDDTPF